VSFLILLATVAFFATLLFGSLSFQHSWERWHKYEGHPFQRADFEVQQVYYKPGQRRWSRDAYAVGLVEGNRESINAADYLQYVPGSQAELDDRVPNQDSGLFLPGNERVRPGAGVRGIAARRIQPTHGDKGGQGQSADSGRDGRGCFCVGSPIETLRG
jgi:hypothetical protein